MRKSRSVWQPRNAACAFAACLLNSGTLINALINVLRVGRVPVSGIYDRTQMADVYRQWQGVPSNRWKVPALHDIIARAHLTGKNSTPYRSLQPSTISCTIKSW